MEQLTQAVQGAGAKKKKGLPSGGSGIPPTGGSGGGGGPPPTGGGSSGEGPPPAGGGGELRTHLSADKERHLPHQTRMSK